MKLMSGPRPDKTSFMKKRQERVWVKMRKLYLTKALRFEKSHESQPRDLSRFWGLGDTPTSRKSVSVHTDALLAKMHPVITDALLATFENPILAINKHRLEK